MDSCPFCQIISGELEASVIHKDEQVLAIVPLHAPYPELAVVFPKRHIDHFTDLPDELAAHVIQVGFTIGQKIMAAYAPGRIGMGVHAHFNVFPQNHPFDVLFRKMAYVKDGDVKFGFKNLPIPARADGCYCVTTGELAIAVFAWRCCRVSAKRGKPAALR